MNWKKVFENKIDGFIVDKIISFLNKDKTELKHSSYEEIPGNIMGGMNPLPIVQPFIPSPKPPPPPPPVSPPTSPPTSPPPSPNPPPPTSPPTPPPAPPPPPPPAPPPTSHPSGPPPPQGQQPPNPPPPPPPNPPPPISFRCWVAREVYGVDNPSWLMFRDYLDYSAPEWFRNLYLNHGENFAKFISNKPTLKTIIRAWMDSKI